MSRLSSPVLFVSSVSGTSFVSIPVSFWNRSQMGRAKMSSTLEYTTTSPVAAINLGAHAATSA
jgi:hypothetical protein